MPRIKTSDDRTGAFALILLGLYWVWASAGSRASLTSFPSSTASTTLSTTEGIAGRAVVSAGVNSSLLGTDFQQGLVSSVVADTAALGANAIGSTWGPTGTAPNAGLQTLSHATLGCAQGALTAGNCASGAAGAAAESVLGHHVIDAAGGLPSDGSGHNTTAGAALYATGVAALGAVAGQAAGGNAQSGANTAINAAANNYLTHNQIVRKQQDLAQALTPEQKAAVNARYNALDAQQQQAAGAQPLGTLLGVQQGLGAPIPGCGVPTNCAADVQQSQQEINGTILLNGGATLPDNGTTLAVISALGAGPLVRGASAVYNALAGSGETGANGGVTLDAAGGVRFGPTNPGPLPDTVANNFRGSSYTQITVSEPVTLNRVSGGSAGEMGQYWTTIRPSGPLQAQIDLALKPEWGNTATQITTIKVPSGQTIYQGAAASQGGAQIGGGSQVFIPRVDPTWVVR